MNIFKLSIFFLIIFNFVQVNAQSNGAVEVYKNHFILMNEKIDSLLNSKDLLTQRQTIREELFAYTKLVHRLQEEIESTIIEDPNYDINSKTVMMLISQGCVSLDFVINAIDKYCQTTDRSFIKLAKDGIELTNKVKGFL